jgi:hypothetical protein
MVVRPLGVAAGRAAHQVVAYQAVTYDVIRPANAPSRLAPEFK